MSGILDQSIAQSSNSNVQEKIYGRCYSLLTNSIYSFTDPLLLKVRRGELDGKTACKQLLRTAILDENGDVSNNKVAKLVFKNLHNFHISWFDTKLVNSNAPLFIYYERGNHNIFDTGEPAIWLTRALFTKNVEIKDAVTSNDTWEIKRPPGGRLYSEFVHPETGAPLPLVYGFSEPDGPTDTDTMEMGELWENVRLIRSGEPIGILRRPEQRLPEGYFMETKKHPNEKTPATKVPNPELFQNFGGGYLGSRPYLTMKIARYFDYKSDGGAKVMRVWSKEVIENTLCRSMPAVLPEHIPEEYVLPSSSLPFRRSKACLSCHASMDQAANVARGVRYMGSTNYLVYKLGMFTLHSYKYRPRLPASTDAWASGEPDPDFYLRPPEGRLFYTDYAGRLVNERVNDIDGLGRAIAEKDDFYICMAKKYYEYFSGNSVDLTAEPLFLSRAPSNFEKKVRDQVIALGLNLKSHQSLLKLVEEIIDMNFFSQGIETR